MFVSSREGTPPKTNMDTRNIMFWKRWLLLNIFPFLVSMLDFGRIGVY